MRDMKGRKGWVTGGLVVLVVALVGALVLTACAPSDGNGGNGYEPPPRPWIVRYGYPTAGLGGSIGIDPETTTAGIVGIQTAESLHRVDPNTHEVVPSLAASWELAPDHSYIDYFIREGVMFHNGDIMTTEDVKFSWERCFDEDLVGGTATVMKRFIDSVEIIGDDQVRVYIKEWTWSVLTSSPIIVPKYYIAVEGWEGWADQPVLTGPFKIVDWERDVYVHYEKAFPEEGHWYYGTDIPNYDELIIYSVVEPSTRLAMMKAGELDAAHVPSANIPDVEDDPNLTVVMAEYSRCWNIIFWDMYHLESPSPFNDPDVRRAVSLAIDREGIAENVYHGTYEPWGSYWSPNIIGYRYREPDPYDPDEARRLLEEAGYPDGFDTYFSYPLGEDVESSAVIACLSEVGIRAEAQGYEPLTWGTMKWSAQHTGMGYLHIPWWGGSRYPDSVFGAEIYDFGGVVDIPGEEEIEDAFDQLTNALTEEELIEAAWAAEDVYFEVNYKIPVWAIHTAFAYGPTIENWDPSWPDDAMNQNLITVQYKG